MTTITIADPTRPDHGSVIVSLLDIYASSHEGGETSLSETAKENLPSALADHPTSHTILAFSEGEPAGMIIAFMGFSTFQCRPLLNIHDVIVHPDHRGKGISKLLMRKAEEIARELGCCKLTLEVLERNEIAKRSYASCGFCAYELDPMLGKAEFWEKKL